MELNAYEANPLQGKKILLAHSNVGTQMQQWHARRQASATQQGYKLSTFSMCEHHPYTIFPQLDQKWRKKDAALMKLYEVLGEKIDNCDIFIHYNGALIHPEFLAQFKQLKIYHCADDPDASNVISKPVANAYDICAISNPSCIDLYKTWGCKQVFFWPLGAFHFDDDTGVRQQTSPRDIPLSFVGSKFGVTRWRYVQRIPLLNKIPGLYLKKAFFEKIEKEFPFIDAYGGDWAKGRIEDSAIPDLYRRTQVGINVHNSLGPINGRLYDLAAYGVCQLCDNKSHLHHVFEPGNEIIGFDTTTECIDLIRYYLAHPEEARAIGAAGQARFQRDYTTAAIWQQFISKVSLCLREVA